MAYPGSVKVAVRANVKPDGTYKVPLRDLSKAIGVRVGAIYSMLRIMRDAGEIPRKPLAGDLMRARKATDSPNAAIADIERKIASGTMDRDELKRTVSDWIRGDQTALQAAGARLLNELHGAEERGVAPAAPMSDEEVAQALAPLIAHASPAALARATELANQILHPPQPSWETAHEQPPEIQSTDDSEEA